MKKLITSALMLSVLFLLNCGGSDSDTKQQAKSSANESGLTEFQMEHGIGPVTEVITIGEIDEQQVEKGKEIFKLKCSACHKVEERYIGPGLGDVLDKRTPTYVMNMIMNPDGMVKKHPVAKQLLAEYMSPMPNQNLERDEALAIVEYLASVQEESTK